VVVPTAVATSARRQAAEHQLVEQRAQAQARDQALARAARTLVTDPMLVRLQLPAVLRGRFLVPPTDPDPRGLHVQALVEHRNLLPVALALLALVATSGCFLAVAARSRTERPGV